MSIIPTELKIESIECIDELQHFGCIEHSYVSCQSFHTFPTRKEPNLFRTKLRTLRRYIDVDHYITDQTMDVQAGHCKPINSRYRELGNQKHCKSRFPKEWQNANQQVAHPRKTKANRCTSRSLSIWKRPRRTHIIQHHTRSYH